MWRQKVGYGGREGVGVGIVVGVNSSQEYGFILITYREVRLGHLFILALLD